MISASKITKQIIHFLTQDLKVRQLSLVGRLYPLLASDREGLTPLVQVQLTEGNHADCLEAGGRPCINTEASCATSYLLISKFCIFDAVFI